MTFDYHHNHFSTDNVGGYFNQKMKTDTAQTVAYNTRIGLDGSIVPTEIIKVRNPGYRGP